MDVFAKKRNALYVAVFGTLSIAAIIWCVFFLFYPESYQSSLFFGDAQKYFYNDYFVPRAVARMPAPYVKEGYSKWLDWVVVRKLDQCYPALANFWVRLFPENLIGAFLCTLIGVVVFVWGLQVLFKRLVPGRGLLAISTACCSSPFIFSVGVANLILYAAGFSFVFLAWHDSESPWRRCIASLALAMATVLKIVPVLLGVLYLDRRWRSNLWYAVMSAVIAIVLFTVPFFCCGGIDAMEAWFQNASLNSAEYAKLNRFGFFGFISELSTSFSFGLTGRASQVLRIVSSSLGFVVLVIGWRLGDDLWEKGCLVVTGMLFIPPTMMYYTALYVLPFVISGIVHGDYRIRQISAVYCVSLCMLLRIPIYYGSANVCFTAAASVDLALALSCILLRRKFIVSGARQKLKKHTIKSLDGREMEEDLIRRDPMGTDRMVTGPAKCL